jgi:cytochrome c-type biogenesis protein CcmH/NrfG
MTLDQMLARLAARLQRDGGNVEGWVQLVRSYRTIEQPDKARAAEADARRALAGDATKLAMFEAGIKQAAAAPPASDQKAADQPAAGASTPPASAAAPAAPGAPAAPAGQDQMIRGMVDRLAARMQQDGSDVDGWIRLVRSYTVLHDADKARAAESDARRALANDPAKLAQLDTGLKEIAASSAAAAAPPPPAPAMSAAPAGPASPAQPPSDMIRGMVDRLAARLREDGSDVDGWLRLLRSYMVLGEADKARAAADEARNALKGDADKLRRLDEGAKSLGVGG